MLLDLVLWSNCVIQKFVWVIVLFDVAARWILGDGNAALFWEDRWLHGNKVQDVAPKYMMWWLQGSRPHVRYDKPFWLRCWTSDRLARCGLPHQTTCPFYNQQVETINHILLTCVFARTLWLWMWSALGDLRQAPAPEDTLVEWCSTRVAIHSSTRDLKTIITLRLWELWKRCNTIVFDGETPSLQLLLRNIEHEGRIWRSAGLIKSDLDSFFGGITRRVGGE